MTRCFLVAMLAGGAAGLLGCGSRDKERQSSPPASRQQRIDRSLAKAAQFLVKKQAADGSWRSETYGPFKHGNSLTPLIVHALARTTLPDSRAACQKGAAFLAAQVQPDGRIDPGPAKMTYPVYTAAGAVLVLSDKAYADQHKARDAWLAYLRQMQLTEDLGWQPDDKPYGGWGYCPELPRKPSPGELPPPLTESNISATLFALEALRAAGVPADDPVIQKALVFVKRCQNYADESQQRDPTFDDGGFIFIYDDAARNKAGVAGKDRLGRERFASYGSTTADGLRALLLCGLPPGDARVQAARKWLTDHFRTDALPGKFVTGRAEVRASYYFYYMCSLAQALQAADVGEINALAGKANWAEAVADELLQKQREDGSWANDAVAGRENDPLVATAMAMLALHACRATVN